MRRFLLFAAGLSMLVSSCTGTPPKDGALGSCHPAALLNPGDSLPNCSFKDFDGKLLNLTSLRGKPLVLNFWASWCGECLKEMPAFNAVEKTVSARVELIGFNVVGVKGETEAIARQFAKARGVEYRLAFDQSGLLYSHFSIQTNLPTTLFVDATGKIAFRQFGGMDEATIRSLLRQYLKV